MNLPFITATISTSMVLLLIGLTALLYVSAGRLSSNLREDMKIEVVVKEGASDSEITAMQKEISGAVYVKECSFISKADALEDMSQQMGMNPAEFLDYNPFYASFQLTLNSGYANADSLAWIEPQLLKMKEVRELNYQRELMDTINSNIMRISAVLLVLALLLALVSTSLINNTIKLTIYAQRFLLHSMKLVGAKWSYIRRPFILKNIWIGILAALLACLVIFFGLKFGMGKEPVLASLMSPELLTPVFVTVFAVGILITMLCSLASVNRFLRMKSGELYYI